MYKYPVVDGSPWEHLLPDTTRLHFGPGQAGSQLERQSWGRKQKRSTSTAGARDWMLAQTKPITTVANEIRGKGLWQWPPRESAKKVLLAKTRWKWLIIQRGQSKEGSNAWEMFLRFMLSCNAFGLFTKRWLRDLLVGQSCYKEDFALLQY